MKLMRVMLACTLLLLASAPVFALPKCGECIMNICVGSSESVEPCRYVSGACEYYISNCTPQFTDSPLTDWAVASIETNRPVMESEIVTIPVDDAEVCTPEPAEAK